MYINIKICCATEVVIKIMLQLILLSMKRLFAVNLLNNIYLMGNHFYLKIVVKFV